MLDMDEDIRELWLEEARAEAREANPLVGYCQRVYFQRTSCRRRGGPHKGKKRRRTTHEVELLKFLPSGRCVTVKDVETPGLDSLAEEVFAGKYIPPEVNPVQLFLDYFRSL
jgi:hypothetical protein